LACLSVNHDVAHVPLRTDHHEFIQETVPVLAKSCAHDLPARILRLDLLVDRAGRDEAILGDHRSCGAPGEAAGKRRLGDANQGSASQRRKDGSFDDPPHVFQSPWSFVARILGAGP